MTSLSSSMTLLVYDHPRFRPHLLGCRVESPVSAGNNYPRNSTRFIGVQLDMDRRSSGFSRRQWTHKSLQCRAEVEKSEPETTSSSPSLSPASSSSPNCCNEEGEKGSSTAVTDAKDGVVKNGDSGIETYGPGKQGNQVFALASVTVAVGLFVLQRLGSGDQGLPQLAAAAISYDEALSNGRPTVVEFYADWCEVCKEMAHDIFQVEQDYRDQINFVMLNVDNTKWEVELDEFGVEGIPHFAFLDKKGNEQGNIVGRLPAKILKENLAALARGDDHVPHTRVVGQFSNADSRQAPPVVGPRSHSQMF